MSVFARPKKDEYGVSDTQRKVEISAFVQTIGKCINPRQQNRAKQIRHRHFRWAIGITAKLAFTAAITHNHYVSMGRTRSSQRESVVTARDRKWKKQPKLAHQPIIFDIF